MKPYPLDLVVWNLGRIIIIGIIGPCNAAGGERGGERGATPRCSPKPTRNQPSNDSSSLPFFSKKVDAEPNGVSLHVRAKPPPFSPAGFFFAAAGGPPDSSGRPGPLRPLPRAPRRPDGPAPLCRPPELAVKSATATSSVPGFISDLALMRRYSSSWGGCGPDLVEEEVPVAGDARHQPPSSLGGLEFGFTILV